MTRNLKVALAAKHSGWDNLKAQAGDSESARESESDVPVAPVGPLATCMILRVQQAALGLPVSTLAGKTQPASLSEAGADSESEVRALRQGATARGPGECRSG